MPRSLSVIICTYNRADVLGEAIDSVISQDQAGDICECIVVDNGSSDQSRDIIVSRASKQPNFKYVSEPRLGLSNARNTGLQNATGEYVAFLDDDAIAEPGWVERIPLAFEAGGPNIGCVAGKILPIWGAPRPAWLHENLIGYISILDYSPVPTLLPEDVTPFGANMAFRKQAIVSAGGFSTKLGRKGSRLLSNEELLLHRRLAVLGYETLYDPRIAVRHHVPATRLTKNWFRQRVFWQGVSNAVLDDFLVPKSGFETALRRMRRLMSILKKPRDLAALLSRSNDPEVFRRAMSLVSKAGYGLAGLYQ